MKSSFASLAHLLSVPEDGHRLVVVELVDEDPDDVPVPVVDVLLRAVDVVRPEDDEVRAPPELPRGVEVQLHGLSGTSWAGRDPEGRVLAQMFAPIFWCTNVGANV